jgi:uncharacterized membrane protein
MTKMVIGIFSDRIGAEDGIKKLERIGYNPKDFSIVMKDTREAKALADETGSDVATGAVSGATGGAIIGGLAGLLGAFVIPGLGAFLIGGPLAAALGATGAAASTISGAATGAVAGGLLGALTSFGLTHDEAKTYEEQIKSGGILVAVPARRGEEEEVSSIMEEYGASQIKVISTEETKESSEKADYRSAYFSDIDPDEE